MKNKVSIITSNQSSLNELRDESSIKDRLLISNNCTMRRIKRSDDIKVFTVLNKGKKFIKPYFILFALVSKDEPSSNSGIFLNKDFDLVKDNVNFHSFYHGVVSSKKIGSSSIRNKYKRLIRESWRKVHQDILEYYTNMKQINFRTHTVTILRRDILNKNFIDIYHMMKDIIIKLYHLK